MRFSASCLERWLPSALVHGQVIVPNRRPPAHEYIFHVGSAAPLIETKDSSMFLILASVGVQSASKKTLPGALGHDPADVEGGIVGGDTVVAGAPKFELQAQQLFSG